MLSFFSVDLVIYWRAIIFASGLTPTCCRGGGLPCCSVAEFSFVQTALYQKVQLQTAWICVQRSDSAEIVCVVCLLWSPRALPLRWLCDYFALALLVSILLVSSFEWMCCTEWGLLELWRFDWLIFLPWWLLFWLVCGLLCRRFCQEFSKATKNWKWVARFAKWKTGIGAIT